MSTSTNISHREGGAVLGSLRRSLFLVSAPMVFIMFALPLRAQDLGASAFQIGLLYSLFTISVFFVRPLTGIGLDILGRRIFFITAMVLYAAANAFYALSDSINELFFARMLQGFGFAILAITADTITADVAEENARSAAMGANIASQARGGMAGAFVGFGLVGAMPLYAWIYSFWIFAAVSALAVIFAAVAMPETRPKDRGGREGAAFKMPPRYHGILGVIFIAAFAGALIQPYYLIYLRGRFGFELYVLALAFLPMGVAHAVLPGLLGRLADRVKRASAVAAGLVVSGVFYILVPAASVFYLVIGAFLAASIGAVLVDLAKNAWVADLSSDATTGRTFGLAALAAGAGAAAGPLVGGFIYDHVGADYLFYGAGAILFAAAVLSLALRPATSGAR